MDEREAALSTSEHRPARGNRAGRGALLLGGITIGAVAAAIVIAAIWMVRSPAGLPAPTIATTTNPGEWGRWVPGAAQRSIAVPSSATGGSRAIDAVVWYPATSAGQMTTPDTTLAAIQDAEPARDGAPYPTVVYSHGSGGPQFIPPSLIAHLASHGFVVIAPSHGSNRLDRPGDLVHVLDAISSRDAGGDALLAGLADRKRAGVVGWSLGGDTALRTAASDRSLRAVVAMAPGGAVPDRSLVEVAPSVTTPTMLMWGMRDDLVPYTQHQTLLDRLGQGGADRWLVTLPGAGHFAFAEQCLSGRAGCGQSDLPQDRAHALVYRWATAFLLVNVADDARYAELLDPARFGDDPDVTITFMPAQRATPGTP